ncbi:probable ATP-dependent RNA helicase DDX43 isoform X2 [Daktulosphaira vitifoliae]|uniref:probable ATP-dependent RNA helicase DDX43 isoform X2 n=1 Tax=Daktulosphaira vitifoliae TaxID=58002 RepID=UPI0021AAE76D|nr:probable ATP-dependent RNA helicase DDX43 isoform X2 [Daktulosphaira vitifoliae]
MASMTIFEIESKMAGKVIGRCGERISSIQQDSGATVKILDSESPNLRKVKLTGTEEQQSIAKNLVESITGKIFSLKIIPVSSLPKNRQYKSSEATTSELEPQIPLKIVSHTRRTKPKRSERKPSPPERIFLSEEVWTEIRRENEERERKKLETLPKIIKEFYVEHSDIKNISDKEVEEFRLAKNNIMVKYVKDDHGLIPKPVKYFEHAFHNYPEIMKQINKQKFNEPTPVQCQAWPIIMSGYDLIAIAQTGTGKTLAFILPALIHLERQPIPKNKYIGPSILILAPTRELVLQIEHEVKKYTYNGINVVSIYGGASAETQTHNLEHKKPEIIVATPGRLNDFLCTQTVDISHVSYLVLDEADRMLDMGFECQIQTALMYVRSDRQTILTSATWPIGVKCLVDKYTINPLHVTIGTFDLTTVNTVKQEIIIINENKKDQWLLNFMKRLSGDDKIIIFMRTKVSVDLLYDKLCKRNVKCRFF